MADLKRTVAIIFEGDSSKATREVDAVAQSLGNLEGTAPESVGKVGEAIDKVGESSQLTDEQARKLGDGLKKLAEDAGVPKEALNSMDGILNRLGVGASGSVVVAAAAVAAFGVVMLAAGSEAAQFKLKVDNLSGGARNAKDEFDFVVRTVRELEVNLGQSLDQYVRFLARLEGTAIPASVAQAAFAGITAAVKGQGGSLEDTKKALDAFVKGAGDGTVDLKNLETQIGVIPGGLRIFAEALGVPIDDLKLLAENGKLGAREIELFAAALRDQDYGTLTPVKDAFVDLWNTIKEIARDVGAEGFINAAWDALEKAIRAVTLAVVGTAEAFRLAGGTLANLLFTITSGDFGGFWERQKELASNFGDGVESAKNKFVGLAEETEKKPEGAGGYKELADEIRNTGDAADDAGPSVKGAADEIKKAAAESKAAAREQKEQAAATAAQAKAFAKAEEDARKFTLEMEKIASNERIKLVEFRVALEIANVEADAKRVVAAFESIGATFASTGEILNTLFAGIEKFDTLSSEAKNIFLRQLEIENKIRQEAWELQKRLTEAEIERIRAQTRRLDRGEALIQVDGAGLQPHLEAFMFEILRAIQVRVNQDGLALLLNE